jgi:hypothetical protein
VPDTLNLENSTKNIFRPLKSQSKTRANFVPDDFGKQKALERRHNRVGRRLKLLPDTEQLGSTLELHYHPMIDQSKNASKNIRANSLSNLL